MTDLFELAEALYQTSKTGVKDQKKHDNMVTVAQRIVLKLQADTDPYRYAVGRVLAEALFLHGVCITLGADVHHARPVSVASIATRRTERPRVIEVGFDDPTGDEL